MSWELINTNPDYKNMFRLYELEVEKDEDNYLTEEELDAIIDINDIINKNGYISGRI